MRTLFAGVPLATLPLAALLLVARPAAAQMELTAVNCAQSAETTAHIRWPAAAPVWEFDLVRPGATRDAGTPNGTGLEVRDAFYLGRKVFERANTPVLNVEYDAGGCGCYRDWSWAETNFVAGGVVPASPCLALPASGSVTSTCDTGVGGTPGAFRGIAFEDYGTELVVSTHMEAGWYRYLMKWHFYADGRVRPEYSFSADRAVCTNYAHRHHVYWRFDFDLEGTPANDTAAEVTGATSTPLTAEAARTWGAPTSGTFWAVRDAVTGAGYDLVPSSADLKVPVDAFSKADALVLRYRANELTDPGGTCAINFGAMANGEPLDGQDLVMWYRSSALHEAGNPFECDVVGPTLRPSGFATATDGAPDMTGAIEVQAAFPNPFAPETSVRFRVAEAQTVRVVLFDAIGRAVRTLFDGPVAGGHYETVRVDGADLPGGIYVVRVEGARASASTRLVLQR